MDYNILKIFFLWLTKLLKTKQNQKQKNPLFINKICNFY